MRTWRSHKKRDGDWIWYLLSYKFGNGKKIFEYKDMDYM